jgi:hypothetical protein
MKMGDRVQVVAQDSEYFGCYGTIVDATKDGQLVVEIDVQMRTWTATFKPHDIDLARRKGKTS